MIELTRTSVMNMENALRGARNPLNSWSKSDSCYNAGQYRMGENDLALAQRLCKAGSDHRKFLRQILVSVDINAPLYWWKEYDTYKVATVSNSTSTMHKIHSKPITLTDFSCDKMTPETGAKMAELVAFLEQLRLAYMACKDQALWYSIIQLLPSSYNQLRTCTLNYETLLHMYHARKAHKLEEWHAVCAWIEALPYAKELIVGE